MSTPQQRPAPVTRLSSGLMEQVKSLGLNALKMAEASLQTPPMTPDGLTLTESLAPSDARPSPGFVASLWDQAAKNRLGKNVQTAIQIATSSPEALDDREMLIENTVTMLANMPDYSSAQKAATGNLIAKLWNDLPHPPVSFLAEGRFRAADGSGNNPAYPQLGAAKTPYAHSVPKCHPTPPNLPDAGLVFDALLNRGDTFTPHPFGVSSLLFSFASLIIHSAFETNTRDPHINDTSSYLDLSILYGNNQAEQDTVRSKVDGELYPDVISSKRLMFMPPSTFALAIAFSRNHNFIAQKLALINEQGRFTAVPNRKPTDELDSNYAEALEAWKSDPDGLKKRDNEIFQTARLINCGFFVNVIFMDYIRVILNLNQTETTWSLTPTGEIKTENGMVERGTGQACSVEFSLLYRWHAAVSAKDERWLNDLMLSLFKKPIEQVGAREFGMKMQELSASYPADPREWPIHGLKRDEKTRRFADADLVKILTEATDEVAGAFGARKTPACMKLIDVLGMATARNKWNTCSFNEFRKFLNLKPCETFQEWNSDPEIARVAEQLYVHPDNLELFVGLHAEEAKPCMPGSGLAPGYTISRGILSDATALVRGDRFLTNDYNSGCLTSWGFQDLTPDMDGGAYGGVVGKLLMRAFPTSYTFNSTYALFPFSTPETTRATLTRFGKLDKYDLSTPAQSPEIKSVQTYAAVQSVMLDTKRFGVYYGANIDQLIKKGTSFFISTDDANVHDRGRSIISAALFPPGWQTRLRDFYATTTAQLIKDKSWSFDGGKTMHLDVVRDVTNMASVLWTSWQFGIPLKTESTPHALFSPKEFYSIISAFFCFVFMNFDGPAGYKLREAALSHAPLIQGIIDARLAQTNGTPAALDGLAHGIQKLVFGSEVQGVVMGTEASAFYRRLLKASDRPLSELNSLVHCTMTASVSNQGEALAHVLNFYLDPVNDKHYKEIVRLAKLDGDEGDNAIRAYIYEALRLDPQVPFVPRVVKQDAVIQDGENEVTVKVGDLLFPSVKNSGRDESVYPNWQEVDITRDPSQSKFRGFGFGMHECLGARICHYTLVAQVKEVFKLRNVRRAPGPAGSLQRIWQTLGDTMVPVYLTSQATLMPLPQSLAIIYDADL